MFLPTIKSARQYLYPRPNHLPSSQPICRSASTGVVGETPRTLFPCCCIFTRITSASCTHRLSWRVDGGGLMIQYVGSGVNCPYFHSRVSSCHTVAYGTPHSTGCVGVCMYALYVRSRYLLYTCCAYFMCMHRLWSLLCFAGVR